MAEPSTREGNETVSWRNWLAFFLMGTINNMPYVIVNSSAKTLADSFNQANNVGLIPWANVAMGFVAKSLNTFFCMKVPYGFRMFVNGLFMLAGLAGIAFAPNFIMVICCIVVTGATASFGENVVLGYLHMHNPKLITAWSSGTGMAGLLGASLYIGLACAASEPLGSTGRTSELRHMNKYVFLLSTPIVLIYWFAYFILLKKSPSTTKSVSESEPEEKSSLIQAVSRSSPEVSQEKSETGESTIHRYWRCFKICLWLAINLGGVYFFEYVARGCVAKAEPKHSIYYNSTCPEFYAAIQLCYQAGVLVSRSSLPLVKIRRVGVVSVLQGINMVVFLFIAWKHFFPVWLLPAYMIFVGLLGGASYVNIFYLLRQESYIPDADREICINITALFISIGIFFGTGFQTLLFDTALKNA